MSQPATEHGMPDELERARELIVRLSVITDALDTLVGPLWNERDGLRRQLAEAVEKATLAERYGEAILAVGAILNADLISDGARINRIRATIAGLDAGRS